MASINRWYFKNRIQIILSFFLLIITGFIVHTKGAPLLEIFYSLTRYLQPYPEVNREAFLKNSLYEELEMKVTQLEAENKQLKQFLKYTKTQKGNLITARIIGRSPDSWWQLITIGVGSKDGVKKDDIVTGIGGLVGKIIEVTPNTSRILLISDPNSRVGASISRTGYIGFIKGNSDETAIMQFYAKVSDVKKGDVVTTSSISTIFPAGIPIGKVISVNLNKSPAPEATIKFSAPIDFLEWVVVISNE